jgi:serine protease
VAPRDFIWEDELPFDLDGHGTHVSGTLGQATNNSAGVAGVAYNVRIMPV